MSGVEETEVSHPLLGRKINSALSVKHQETLFESNLSQQSPAYLADHRILGRSILPATAYLEAVLAAGKELLNSESLVIEDFIIQRALLLPDDPTSQIKVQVIFSQEVTGYHWQIYSQVGEGWTEHAQGRIAKAGVLDVVQSEWTSIQDRCRERLSVSKHYEWFQKHGIEYGEQFRTIEELFRGNQEALGRVQLPNALITDSHNYLLHPVLLDACLQVAVSIIASETDELLLPVGLDRLTLFAKLEEQSLWAHVKRVDSGNGYKMNITLFNEEGRPLAELLGFSVRVATKQALLANLQAGMNDFSSFYYIPKWEAREIAEPVSRAGDPQGKQKGRTLLVYPTDISTEMIVLAKALLRERSSSIPMEIILGEGERQHHKMCWEIRKDNPTGFDSMTKQLEGVQGICFLSGQYMADEQGTRFLSQSREEGINSLFRLVQKLKGNDFFSRSSQSELIVLTSNVWQVVEKESYRNPYIATLTGFTRSLGNEFPETRVQCLDLCLSDIQSAPQQEQIIKQINKECSNSKIELVALRQGIRYQCCPTPLQLQTTLPSAFKKKGVYLIIGGAGGIGLALSEYLARTYQARLVLVGRRQADLQLNEKFSRIESLGGEVLYCAVDIADFEGMQGVVRQAKESFGGINGVIHSALVLRDQTVVNMSEESLNQVLQPKVNGSLILQQALQGEQLDFLLFFSSIVSFIGSAGQSNYVAANSFKDSFAGLIADKTSYPVKVINWGAWGDTGVAATQEYQELLVAQGIHPIKTEKGMQAIEQVLANPFPQVLAAEVDQQGRDLLGVLSGEGSQLATKMKQVPILKQQLEDAIPYKRPVILKSHIRKEVAKVTGKIPNDQQGFFGMGIDSLASIQFATRLSKELGLSLPATTFMEYPTIEKLTNHLIESLLSWNQNESPEVETLLEDEVMDESQQSSEEDELDDLLDEELAKLESLL
ncbi:MAG: hypothetical protein COB67_11530 [SAR324 cluster bacterium]|uniref:Uncharacterized protein n=1 Tax=SAR324 cluster bacterium TaxID=2024889 RepID=A0A2A4SUJ5_9DELT|nr:MAG: hypothetical protein COB67_11530 [SAR324 cluster bacterium]